MELGQFAEASAPGSILQQGHAVDLQGRPADAPAFELGAPHSGAHPLDNKVALQFGDGADDHDHGPAQRAAGVDVLPEADKLEVEMSELVQNFEEVAD